MRITTENRTRLETVIPLSTPYVIFIDPANVCNQKCSYCPTSHPDLLKSTYRKPAIMDWDHCSYEGEEMIDRYVGMDKAVNMLMKKLKVGLRRPASEICLVEIVETPAGISGKGGPDGKSVAAEKTY